MKMEQKKTANIINKKPPVTNEKSIKVEKQFQHPSSSQLNMTLE